MEVFREKNRYVRAHMVLYFKNGSQIEILSCHNPNVNTTQPYHCSWVGHENDFANPTQPTQPQKLNDSLQKPQNN